MKVNSDSKALSLVYHCQYPVKQIECSLVESSRTGGMMDVVVVTAGQVGQGQEALLFHFPWDAQYRPGCKVLYTSRHHDLTQGFEKLARGGCSYLFLTSAASGRNNGGSENIHGNTSYSDDTNKGKMKREILPQVSWPCLVVFRVLYLCELSYTIQMVTAVAP